MIASIPVFVGLTLVLFGGCAFMAGQSRAKAWKSWPVVVVYGLMLGAADRFLGFALFGGQLLSLPGWLLDSSVLVLIGLTAWRITLARQMCRQYPWLYERTGPFGWRDV